jgi:uncharacterized protein YndB with AHSA1/START domain
MMRKNLVASASITVNAPRELVWHALTDPDSIQRYMFGARVTTSWAEGTPIYWRGEWQGRPYEDKGIVLDFEPPKCLEFSHYSARSGLPDVPSSYHTVTIKLAGDGEGTRVALEQDNNPDEKAREHSQKNWQMMLKGLKDYVEQLEDKSVSHAASASPGKHGPLQAPPPQGSTSSPVR